MRTLPFILLGLLLAGCSKDVPPTETPLRPVYITKISNPSQTVSRSFSGQVRSAENSSVSFTVSGRLISVKAVAGQTYKKGDILAQVDPTDFSTQLAEAEARHTEAQSNMRRTQSLFENGNASKSQLESAMASAQAARASYDAAKKRVNDCTLTMPYDGLIGRVVVNEQEMVNAGQEVMSILAQSDSLEFDTGIPAEWIGQVSIGMSGNLTIQTSQARTAEAKVSEIGAEPESNTTYPVTFTFSNGHDDIREGMDGEVSLNLPNPQGAAITIPVSCVAALPGDVSYVYKVMAAASGNEGTVERQEVKTGRVRSQGRIEILEGLSTGDIVVARGVHSLEPGMQVALREGMEK